MELFKEGAIFITLGVQGVLAWALWSLRRSFVSMDVFDLHVAKSIKIQQHLENRLVAVESLVTQLPDNDNINALAQAIESLRGDIKVVDARISGVDRLMVRLERALDRQDCAREHGNRQP